MDKKRVKILILLGIIILLLIIMICMISLGKTEKKEEEINHNTVNMEYISQGKIYPDYYSDFKLKYKGNINKDLVYKRFHIVCKERLPQIYKETKVINTKEELEKYYEKNKFIKEQLGMTNFSDFNNLVETMKKYNVNNLEYVKASIDKNSCKYIGQTANFNMDVYYNENIKMKFHTLIPKELNSSNNIKFILIIEE